MQQMNDLFEFYERYLDVNMDKDDDDDNGNKQNVP